jgi:hypothetical protein
MKQTVTVEQQLARINEQQRRDWAEFDRKYKYDTPGYRCLFEVVLFVLFVLFVVVLLPCVSYLYFY